MRTQKEILDHIKEVEKDDFFGTEVHDLICFLDYENAKDFLKDGVTKEAWEESQQSLTKEHVLQIIANYMKFAWDKANDRRSLSAGRSIDHMQAWTWLIDDKFYKKLKKSRKKNYKYYGKPLLVMICEHFNIDWEKLDDDEWTNHEDVEGVSYQSLISELGEL